MQDVRIGHKCASVHLTFAGKPLDHADERTVNRAAGPTHWPTSGDPHGMFGTQIYFLKYAYRYQLSSLSHNV